MIEKEEERMLFAMAALIGLVMRGESPVMAANQMWQYADFATNQKDLLKEKNEQY